MPNQLQGKKVIVLVEELFDVMELMYSRLRLEEAGAKVTLAGPKAKETYTSVIYNNPVITDETFQAIKGDQFDALVIPGGFAPDRLRRHAAVLELVQYFHRAKKPIGFICHGGWVPVSAQVLKGVRCTSVSSIKDDLINAGADWTDEPVVVDRHFVSSRRPEDLPYFCPALIKLIAGS
jgi:protease I